MKKTNFAPGAGVAAGAAAGVAAGAAFSPQTANGAEISTVETAEETPRPVPQPAPVTEPEATPKAASTPHHAPIPETEPIPEREPKEDVEVVGYNRVTNGDGTAMDVAVLSVNGTEMDIIDINLNGEADFIVCDLNGNGAIDHGEVEDVQGLGIDMRPLQEAAGFSPDYARDTLPDYVNDAEVDTFMA